MTITKEQSDAYFATEYRVIDPEGVFILHARGDHPWLAELHRLLNLTSSAFITAYNPFSQTTDPSVNSQSQERLIAEVDLRWKYLSGEGVDPLGKWPPEPSLLILGINLEEALMLGRKFGQNAIVFANAQGSTDLRACNPEHQSLLIHPLERSMQHIQESLDDKAIPASEKVPRDYVANFVPRAPSPAPPTENNEELELASNGALAGILLLQGATTGIAPLSPKAIALLGYIMRHNWICPQHGKWMEMWQMLPEIDGMKPAGPIPLQAWRIWDHRIRHEFLMRHIECADKRGVIDQVDQYLRALQPEDWVEGFYALLSR